MSQSHFCHNNTYVTKTLMSQRHIWHNDTYVVTSSERSHRDGITGCWIGSQDLIASDEDDWAASSSCRLRNTCLDRGFSRVFFDVQKTSVQACVCICARTCARQFLLLLGHNYIGRNCIGRNYIGHNYIGNSYIGRNDIGHNYTGHSYIGHTNIGHNYIDHNYIGHRAEAATSYATTLFEPTLIEPVI